MNVGIEVTRRCNFRCAHCFVDAGLPRRQELSTPEWLKVLGGLAQAGVENIGWSGGEPLLHKGLDALTAKASDLGMASGLATNGFLASLERLRQLEARGLSVLQVSLDGPDPARAARFRQGPKAAFDRAVRAVRAGIEVGLKTYICALLTPETAAEVEEMIALATELGADGLRYTMFAPVGRAHGQAYDEHAWSSKAVRRFLEIVAHGQTRAGLSLLVDCPTGPLPFAPRIDCGAGSCTAYVTADGEVYPCTALIFPSYRVGNIRATPVKTLLASPAMLKAKRQRARLRPQGTCKGCALTNDCRGGCPGRTVAAFGRLSAKVKGGAMPVCLLRLHAPPEGRGPARRRRASR